MFYSNHVTVNSILNEGGTSETKGCFSTTYTMRMSE